MASMTSEIKSVDQRCFEIPAIVIDMFYIPKRGQGSTSQICYLSLCDGL